MGLVLTQLGISVPAADYQTPGNPTGDPKTSSALSLPAGSPTNVLNSTAARPQETCPDIATLQAAMTAGGDSGSLTPPTGVAAPGVRCAGAWADAVAYIGGNEADEPLFFEYLKGVWTTISLELACSAGSGLPASLRADASPGSC